MINRQEELDKNQFLRIIYLRYIAKIYEGGDSAWKYLKRSRRS